MAIQGNQNISGITFNNGTSAPITEVRIASYNAFSDTDLSGYQQGGDITFGITNNNYYVTSGVTGINNNYTITGTGQYFNIEDFGARPNQDSTAAIQAAINAAASGTNRRGVFIPGNWYHITGTLTIPTVQGFSIICAGGMSASDMPDESHAMNGCNSTLVWQGTGNGHDVPMLRSHCYGLVVQGALNLRGRRHRTHTGYADIGLEISKGVEGLGQGKIYIPTITASYCKAGIQIGRRNDILQSNNDNIVIGFYGCFDNLTGYNMLNGQGLNHHFAYVKVANYITQSQIGRTTFANVVGGGNFHINGGAAIATTTWLNFTNARLDGVGHNNSDYTLRDIKFDNNATGTILLEMNTGLLYVPVTCRFEAIDTGPDDYYQSGYYLINAYGNTKITLSMKKVQRNMVRLKQNSVILNGYPNFSLHDSRVLIDATGSNQVGWVIDTGNSLGTYYWSSRNNSDDYGRPFRDTGNYAL